MVELSGATNPNSGNFNLDKSHKIARSLTVAIPAFNEERNIEATIATAVACAKKIPDLCVEILVVDDGSTDRTAEIVRNLSRQQEGVRLIQNTKNIGLGASIRRAIEAAQRDKFLIIPGDNDIPVNLMELLFKNAYAAEVVMCYFHNDELRGRPRFLLSTLFKLIYTTCFDLYAQYLNGPAVYPVNRLREIDLHSTKFSIVSEINVKLLRQGVTFVEIPSSRRGESEKSTSFSFRNLIETANVFFQVLLDVYVRSPTKYGHRPVRLSYELSLLPAIESGMCSQKVKAADPDI